MSNPASLPLSLRIKEIKSKFNLNNKELGAIAGISGQGIADIENGITANPRMSVFTNLSSKLDLSPAWLLNGEGPMNRQEAPAKVITSEIAKADGVPEGAIPLYDIDINAGNVQRLIEAQDHVPLVGWVHLEDIPAAQGLIGVRAKGDSMATYINSGDVMLIRRIEDWSFINFGYPHVIIGKETTAVKYLRKGPDPDTWILRSHNDIYEDFDIPKASVKHLFAVVKVLKDITY